MRIDEVEVIDDGLGLQILLRPVRSDSYIVFSWILLVVVVFIAIPLGVVAVVRTFGTSSMFIAVAGCCSHCFCYAV